MASRGKHPKLAGQTRDHHVAARDLRNRADRIEPDRRTGAGIPDEPRSRRCHRCRTQRKRSEEHTSELQSLMRISYAVFCLKKKKNNRMYDIYINTISRSATITKTPEPSHT